MRNRFGGSFMTFGVGLAAGIVTPNLRVLAEQRYAVKPIDMAPHDDCYPSDLNDLGHIAITCEHREYSFFWTPEDGAVELVSDDSQPLATGDLNNHDMILLRNPNARTCFIWTNGQLQRFEDLVDPKKGWSFTTAEALNDAGQIVGRGNRGAFVMTPGEPYYEIVNLTELFGTYVNPTATNELGAVAGNLRVDDRHVAFIWHQDEFHNLGNLGGNQIAVYDINENFEVVGQAQTEKLEVLGRAFLWRDGVMQDLGTLGGGNSVASDINNDGFILGGSDRPLLSGPPACYWKDGPIRRLIDRLPCGVADAVSSSGLGLNEKGQIAATVVLAGNYPTPCLLTPLPPAIRDFQVTVFRGSTIELTIETDLIEGSRFSVVLDDHPCEPVTADAQGRVRHRWFNQTGVHTVCIEGLDRFCAMVECAPRPAGYVIRELPALHPDKRTNAVAVNDRGQVAGDSEAYEGYTRHAAWWTDRGCVDLGDGYAYDINGSEWIVGETDSRATLWRDGEALTLNALNNYDGAANSLNDAGQIVGMLRTTDPGTSAALWIDLDVALLPHLDGTVDCEALEVNEHGEIVGQCDDRPVYWPTDQPPVALESLGGDHNLAKAVNDDGIIVGYVGPTGNRPQLPAIWTREGALTILPTLDESTGRALDVNQEGLVVGHVGYRRATLWRDGVPQDMNELIHPGCPWDYLETARGVSDGGHIVGGGYIHGRTASFLLTPAYPGNIKALSARCKRGDVVVRVKTWLPERTVVTAAADTGQSDCLTVDAGGRAKTRLLGAAGATRVCLREYEDLCEPVNCP
ncbi:MAG: hypothetical protein FLDDKLPJ_02723 [Phycisphaerae bacterium]|nr:hypothetical protein [Phycisphaerae bacterium]